MNNLKFKNKNKYELNLCEACFITPSHHPPSTIPYT